MQKVAQNSFCAKAVFFAEVLNISRCRLWSASYHSLQTLPEEEEKNWRRKTVYEVTEILLFFYIIETNILQTEISVVISKIYQIREQPNKWCHFKVLNGNRSPEGHLDWQKVGKRKEFRKRWKAQFLQNVQTPCGLLPFSTSLPFSQPFLHERISFEAIFLALHQK